MKTKLSSVLAAMFLLVIAFILSAPVSRADAAASPQLAPAVYSTEPKALPADFTPAPRPAVEVAPAPAPAPATGAGAIGPLDGLSGITAENIVTWLTPVLVPLLIAGFKKIAPSIPSWVLPILAPLLGVLMGVVNNLMNAHSGSLVVAALLGLAGVGIREVKDQLKPSGS